MPSKELNPKQRRFVDEYLVDLNAKQAAIRAGYSPKTAESQGSRLLSHAKVSEAIQHGQAQIANKYEVTQEYVIEKLIENLDGSLREGQRGPANGALTLLGKHIGMFVDRTRVEGPNGGPVQVEDAAAARIASILATASKRGA
jgi:phage terminase small subunit